MSDIKLLTEIYAYVSPDDVGGETLTSVVFETGETMTLVSPTLEFARKQAPLAAAYEAATGKKTTLVRFTGREEVRFTGQEEVGT